MQCTNERVRVVAFIGKGSVCIFGSAVDSLECLLAKKKHYKSPILCFCAVADMSPLDCDDLGG